MLPWLSNGVLRYAIVLSLAWSGLAAIVVATSGAVGGEAAAGPPGPPISKVVQVATMDPCTHELIALDARIVVNATSLVDGDVIRTDGVMTLTGWAETGSARDARNVAANQRFTFSRATPMGLLEPAEVRLTVVNRPNLPATVLAVHLQETWEGANPTLIVSDSYLGCA